MFHDEGLFSTRDRKREQRYQSKFAKNWRILLEAGRILTQLRLEMVVSLTTVFWRMSA